MSEITDITLAAIKDRSPYTNDAVQNVTQGFWFDAEIDGKPDPLAVMTELGSDNREVTCLYVTDIQEAFSINDGDILGFQLFGKFTKHKVIKRKVAPGLPQAEFWCIVGRPGLDEWA